MEAEFSRLASLLEQDGAKRESIGKEVRSEEGEERKNNRGRRRESRRVKVLSTRRRCRRSIGLRLIFLLAPSVIDRLPLLSELNRIFRSIQFTLQKVHNVCNDSAGEIEID